LQNQRAPVGALRLNGQLKTKNHTPGFFRTHLTEALLPFWQQHASDSHFGGFITHLDRQGKVYDDSLKTAAMQARMVYGFSSGYELSGSREYLQLAKQGLRFLIDNFWDREQGGWYQDVHRDGRVRTPYKDSFAQAYVLLGLAECYRLTHETEALVYAKKTYEVMERHLWDSQNLGYYETCYSDWREKSTMKTICIQLDMLIAIMTLYGITRDQAHLSRACQLANLITTRMIDRSFGGLLERFSRDWSYQPVVTHDQLWIGHCLKGAWLLLEMDRLTGVQNYFNLARNLVDYCLRHGWDNRYGGFYQYVFRRGRVASGEKIWWTQCEGMQALLLLYSLCGEEKYLEYFRCLADYAFTNFYDVEYGEWVASCYADGAVKDERKGGTWKAAYHTVQMCYSVQACLSGLKS
jgi:mannobiose 2-epimerase